MASALDQVLKVEGKAAQEVFGAQVQRKGIMRNVWNHIHKHKLQDAKNGQVIHVERDPHLRAIYGNKPIKMTQLMRPALEHMKPK
jgi:chromatin remodeling complex protein RSC6